MGRPREGPRRKPSFVITKVCDFNEEPERLDGSGQPKKKSMLNDSRRDTARAKQRVQFKQEVESSSPPRYMEEEEGQEEEEEQEDDEERSAGDDVVMTDSSGGSLSSNGSSSQEQALMMTHLLMAIDKRSLARRASGEDMARWSGDEQEGRWQQQQPPQSSIASRRKTAGFLPKLTCSKQGGRSPLPSPQPPEVLGKENCPFLPSPWQCKEFISKLARNWIKFQRG